MSAPDKKRRWFKLTTSKPEETPERSSPNPSRSSDSLSLPARNVSGANVKLPQYETVDEEAVLERWSTKRLAALNASDSPPRGLGLTPLASRNDDEDKRARRRLQSESGALEMVLQKMKKPSSQYLPDLQDRIDHATTDPSKASKVFDIVVDQVVKNGSKNDNNAFVKCITQVSPILKTLMGVSSFIGNAATVLNEPNTALIFTNLTITANALSQVFDLCLQPIKEAQLARESILDLTFPGDFIATLRTLPASALNASIMRQATEVMIASTSLLRISLNLLRKNYKSKLYSVITKPEELTSARHELKIHYNALRDVVGEKAHVATIRDEWDREKYDILY